MKSALFKSLSVALAFTLLIVGTVFVQAAPAAQDDAETVVDAVSTDSDLSALAGAIETAGLSETLAGEGPFTVFAPTNEALESADLPEDLAELTDLLLYHVVPGEVDADSGSASTALGDSVEISSNEDGELTVNGIVVTEAAIAVANGVVYKIGSVLSVPAAEGEEDAAAEGDDDAAAEGDDDAAAEGDDDAAAEGDDDAAAEGDDDAAAEGEEDAAAEGDDDAAAEGDDDAAAEGDDDAAAEGDDDVAADDESAPAASAAPASDVEADDDSTASRSGRSRSEYKSVWKCAPNSGPMKMK